MAVRKSGIYYSVLITRGEEEEGDRSERVDREEEGGRGGGGGKGGEGCRRDYCRQRLRVDRGRCARRGVHSFDAWISRAVASTRPPSTA